MLSYDFFIKILGMCGIGMHVCMCCFHVGVDACGGCRLVFGCLPLLILAWFLTQALSGNLELLIS